MTTTLPPEAKKLCWGGFWFGWIWGIFNNSYIALISLIFPFFNLILLFKGRTWAWENKSWKSPLEFDRYQNLWGKIGFIIFICLFALVLMITVIIAATTTYQLSLKEKSMQLPSSDYERELSTRIEYYNNFQTIRAQTADDPHKILVAAIAIGYDANNTVIEQELIEKTEHIKNLIFMFLSEKSADELQPEFLNSLQADLKIRINTIMIEKIEEVLFTELQVF